jgi:F420-non-reducing hydrogenase large subunit
MGQTIVVSPVTRIEGHARIALDLDDQGAVTKGRLQVLEIRGFEKLLLGMELSKMPLMTARLCGVCPAAHHLASVTAIEAGLGVAPPADAALLRELLYAGHILHSHALSNFVLSGPDLFLGIGAPPETRNVFHLLGADPDLAKKILRLRSLGQRTVEVVGGRGIHPVTVIPGGMTARPAPKDLEAIAGWGAEALALLAELGAALQKGLAALAELRDRLTIPYRPLAFSWAGRHTFLGGEIVVPAGPHGPERRFAPAAYADHLVEHAVPGSYMKTVRLRGTPEASFFVGPLARLRINGSLSTPLADEKLQAFRERQGPQACALDNVEARWIEMLHCAERMARIPGELPGGPLAVPVEIRAGRYAGAIEAPRGLLVHDYTADAQGKLTAVNLIVATQNNYDAMDHAVTSVGGHFAGRGDDNLLLNGMEFALRCYDPCLACATHLAGRMPLEVEVRRGGRTVRTIARRAAP